MVCQSYLMCSKDVTECNVEGENVLLDAESVDDGPN